MCAANLWLKGEILYIQNDLSKVHDSRDAMRRSSVAHSGDDAILNPDIQPRWHFSVYSREYIDGPIEHLPPNDSSAVDPGRTVSSIGRQIGSLECLVRFRSQSVAVNHSTPA